MEKSFVALALAFVSVACGAKPEKPGDDEQAARRAEMLKTQIAGRGITDPRVLAAMKKVPRHLFMPDKIRARAYEDTALPIGHGQTISQPYIVAFMTASLDLKPDCKVLEIGTGSGYQAAVFAELVEEVYTIEIIDPLGRQAGKALEEAGFPSVKIRIGDGYLGWPEQAPFDAIMVTCAPDAIPQPLIDQLAEGGRMIIPVGPRNAPQELVLIRKTDGEIQRRAVLPVRFVPMTGKAEE